LATFRDSSTFQQGSESENKAIRCEKGGTSCPDWHVNAFRNNCEKREESPDWEKKLKNLIILMNSKDGSHHWMLNGVHHHEIQCDSGTKKR